MSAPAQAAGAAPLGRIHSTESFGAADGPGVRFVIFVQGCAMRCQYCHNPDTWDLCAGQRRTADELLAQALRYQPYWGGQGGITVSGGEPLLQIEFVTDLFRKAKAAGVHTALDTAGQPFTRAEPFYSRFQALLQVTDLVLLDLKQMDEAAHRALTGCGNANILQMARAVDEAGVALWVRRVLVPGVTDDPADLAALGAFLRTLHCLERVEVLPYHTLGLHKWQARGLPYPLEGVQPPTAEQVRRAEETIRSGKSRE